MGCFGLATRRSFQAPEHELAVLKDPFHRRPLADAQGLGERAGDRDGEHATMELRRRRLGDGQSGDGYLWDRFGKYETGRGTIVIEMRKRGT